MDDETNVDEAALSNDNGTEPGDEPSTGDPEANTEAAPTFDIKQAGKALNKATKAVEKSALGATALPSDADEEARAKAARALRLAAEKLFAAADVVEGEQPDRSLLLGRNWNKVELNEVFSGLHKTRPDWFFAVADCHTESLDIRYMQIPARKDQPADQYWAESDRPCYTFAVGDTFYDSRAPLAPGNRWGDVVGEVRHTVQVVEASASSLKDMPWPADLAQPPIRAGGKKVQFRRRRETEDYTHRTEAIEGTVRFELRHYADGKPGTAWKSPLLTQTEFKEFLRTGVLSGVIKNLSAKGAA